jgi:two-component system, chemotaxis family, chemotaxis protein CheY
MRVLTVDDSATMQEMIVATLMGAGYEAVTADNGIEALKLLKTEAVDLIISDVNMTHMGGFEFVSRVRELDEFQYTPILFLTTEASKEFKAIGREIGATGWLTKPFDPTELVRVIKRVLP